MENNFYNHFTQAQDAKITGLGKIIVQLENRTILNLAKKHISTPKANVLEIGPGLGFFATECISSGYIYTAIEANQIMAQHLREDGYNVISAFVPPIPGPDLFDIIFMNQVFEHMKNRDQAAELIQSCKEHLAKEGILVISSPDIEFWKEDFFVGDYTHDYPTSQKRLEQIFIDNGMDILHSSIYSIIIAGRLAVGVLTLLVRGCYRLGFFHLLFGKKAFKAKSSLLPSCLIIGKKLEH